MSGWFDGQWIGRSRDGTWMDRWTDLLEDVSLIDLVLKQMACEIQVVCELCTVTLLGSVCSPGQQDRLMIDRWMGDGWNGWTVDGYISIGTGGRENKWLDWWVVECVAC